MRRIILYPTIALLLFGIFVSSFAFAATTTNNNMLILQKDGIAYVIRAKVLSKRSTIEQVNALLNMKLNAISKNPASFLSITHSGHASSHKSHYINVGSGGDITLDSYLYAYWYLSNPLDYDHVTVKDTYTEAAWLGYQPFFADSIDYTSKLVFSGLSISVSGGIPPSASVSAGITSASVTYSHSWNHVWWARINWVDVSAKGIWIYKVEMKDTAAFVFSNQAYILGDQLDVVWIH